MPEAQTAWWLGAVWVRRRMGCLLGERLLLDMMGESQPRKTNVGVAVCLIGHLKLIVITKYDD